eukprot:752563-Hanusia_phi.AAC.1
MNSQSGHTMSTTDNFATEQAEAKSGPKSRHQPMFSKRRRKIRLITPEVFRQISEAYARYVEGTSGSGDESEMDKDERSSYSASFCKDGGVAMISSTRPINKEIAQEYSSWCENFLDSFPILYQSLQLQNGRADALAFILQIFQKSEQKASQGLVKLGPSVGEDAPAESRSQQDHLAFNLPGGDSERQTVAKSGNRLTAYFQEMLHDNTLRECIAKLIKIFRDLQHSNPRASISPDGVGKLDMYNSKMHKVLGTAFIAHMPTQQLQYACVSGQYPPS